MTDSATSSLTMPWTLNAHLKTNHGDPSTLCRQPQIRLFLSGWIYVQTVIFA